MPPQSDLQYSMMPTCQWEMVPCKVSQTGPHGQVRPAVWGLWGRGRMAAGHRGPVGGPEHVERQAQQQPWGCMLLLAAAVKLGRWEGPECPWPVHGVGDLGGHGGVEQAP